MREPIPGEAEGKVLRTPCPLVWGNKAPARAQQGPGPGLVYYCFLAQFPELLRARAEDRSAF